MWRLLVLSVCAALADWTDCPSACSCKWSSGKKSAICRHAGYTTLPITLDPEMQVLDLSGNSIPFLGEEAFKTVGLLNLQKIFLKRAGLKEIHHDAFRELTILIEVDLSDNAISTLHRDTFMGNDRLKILYLNGNPLTELKDAQFPVLPHLKSLELQHCRIEIIHREAFVHLIALESLNLNGNKLKRISQIVFSPIKKLKTLSIDGNPWNCDCELRGFRNWLLSSNFYSHSLSCTEPKELASEKWEDVNPKDFACPPTVITLERAIRREQGENVTLKCKISGDPEPNVSWYYYGKLISNDTDNENISTNKKEDTIDTNKSSEKWSFLNLVNVSDNDAGEYTCAANNVRGRVTANVSLLLPEILIATTLSKGESWPSWIAWVAVSCGIVLIITFLICVTCTYKRCGAHSRRRGRMKNSASFTDQDKKLLDASITTTTDRQTGSFEGLGSQADIELSEHSLQSIPMEVCEHPVHITIESRSTDPAAVSLYRPPVEYATSTLPSGVFGNIFISVSVGQDPSSEKYPDLLDLPHRKNASVGTNDRYAATLPRRRNNSTATHNSLLPQYDNMGPRVTAAGSSTLSLPGSTEDIPPPPPPPSCTPVTVDYVSL